jgi:hypothetical protein
MKRLTRSVLNTYPEVLFVVKQKDGDREWWSAHETVAEGLEDDGPAVVAHYQLTGAYKLQRAVRTIESVTRNRK